MSIDAEAATSSPSTDYDYKMILAGAGCVAAMSTYGAYRAKWTNVFKASYASTWLTLGPATLMYVTPDEATQRERIAKASRGRATAVEAGGPIGQTAEERRAQIETIRRSVGGGRREAAAAAAAAEAEAEAAPETKKGWWWRR